MDSSKPAAQPESKLHFLDYWRIIRIRKTVILAVFLLVVLTATLVTYILPPSFSATARIQVEQNNPDIPGLGQASNQRMSYDPYFIQTEFEVLQSQAILGPVIKKLNLNEEWGKKYNGGQPLRESETMEYLKHSMHLNPVRNASIIEIEVRSDTPDDAAKIANTIAETYEQYRKSLSKSWLESGIEALQQQWDAHLKTIRETQNKVDELRTKLGISDTDPMSIMASPTMSQDVVKQLQANQLFLEINAARQQTQLTNLLKLDPKDLRSAIQTSLDQPDASLTTLLAEHDNAQLNVLALEKSLQSANPTMSNAVQAVQLLDSKIDDKVKGILLGLQNKLNATTEQIDEITQKFDNAKTNDLYMAQKSRPYYDLKQQLSDLLQFKTVLGMKIAATQTEMALPHSAMVTIIDHAVADPDPVSPKKGLNIALGIVVGLVVGVGLAFFIEYLDTSVKTIDDVERTLQTQVLGVIPQNVGFLLEEGADSPHAEAYRVLRTNVLFSRKDEKLNSMAIVSAGAGEGKSTTVMNLATVFAQNGNRVIIVDSDLRRPTLHKMLRVTNNLGLTNYLLKQNTLDEVIQTTSLPTLDFMASGKLPSSSMGVLSSIQMRNLISDLKQRYDYVFFDSPPIMGVSDASILASEVDFTMQVIQYRRYPQPMNIRAKQMIEKVGGNLLGIVLNNINMSQDENYYYYSGYYHEYYSKAEDEDSKEASGSGKKP